MRSSARAATAVFAAAAVNASSLTDLCTVANVQAALPDNGTLSGIELLPASVTASVVYVNTSATDTLNAAGGSTVTLKYNYCNVTIDYQHTGDTNPIMLWYSFPDPADFANRFYVGGGSAYTASTTPLSGLNYGAVSGSSDLGYDGYDDSYDAVVLKGNGTIDWDNTVMFSYQGLGETTIVGKAITNAFYGISNDTKIYTYFEGCSDGGREAMSQAQRYGEEYDGIIAGAPAFRLALQQPNHLFPVVAETVRGYFPPPCELAKIVNLTLNACDGLDGKVDGVMSRSDLCKLNLNLTSFIGESYYCAAATSTSLGFGFNKRQQTTGSSTTSNPVQNGTVSAEGVALAQLLIDGMHSTTGERIYFPFQIGAEFSDAATQYNSNTSSWEADIGSNGGEWVTRFIDLTSADNLDSVAGYTYDTILDIMNIGLVRYENTLQTNIPDLSTFHKNGGKLIHYHGEQDPSVPTPSSVHYWEAVMSVMYANLTRDESIDAIGDWYRLFIVPGAAHCGVNDLQPDGPYPRDNMNTMIDWVENGVFPERLNTTIAGGANVGATEYLCPFPTRPYWKNGTELICETDALSAQSWSYTLDAFKLPIY